MPPNPYIVWYSLTSRGSEQLERYHATKDLATIQEAVQCFRNAIPLSIKGIGDSAGTFGMLGTALLDLFKHVGDRKDLDAAIISDRISLNSSASQTVQSDSLNNNLASALMARFELDGTRSDLDEAIAAYRRIVELRPLGHPDRSSVLSNLSNALRMRHDKGGGLQDLEEAIVVNREALDLTPQGSPSRPIMHHNLALASLARFKRSGNRLDLDEAIISNNSALELRPPGHPDRHTSLDGLADTLQVRFQQDGERRDLDDAIKNLSEASEITPPGHPYRGIILDGLANSLSTRFEYFGDPTDLNEAIEKYYAVIELRPRGHPHYPASLSNIASHLCTRFDDVGNIKDLSAAIKNSIEALRIVPHDHPSRASILDVAASALSSRFNTTGDRADLDEAIAKYRNVLEMRPPGNPNRSAALSNLGGVLHNRFEQVGDEADLSEATYLHRAALELRPPGHLDRFASFINLGCTLLDCFGRSGKYPDLEESIIINRNALEFTSPGHPSRTICLNNLAKALHTSFKHTGDVANLDEAISHNRGVLEQRPPGHPDRSISLSNLADNLLDRFREIGDLVDLDEAIVNNRSALELRPSGHPDRSASLNNLAATLWHRLEKTTMDDKTVASSTSQSLSEIIELLEEAAGMRTSGPSNIRLAASLAWVSATMKWSHPSTIRAYRTSLEVLDILVASSGSLESRHARLTSEESRKTRTLAVDGASYALDSGNVELAVEMSEQGRSVLLTQAGRYRTRVDQLEKIYPALAARFGQASEKMERSIMSPARSPKVVPNVEDVVATYQNFSKEWMDVVRQIRSLGGFESFLQPTPFSVLREVAINGPVILVNYSRRRTDAIILRPNGDPRLVELPNANPESIMEMVESAHHKTGNNIFKILLANIWRIIVEPVVAVLQGELQLPPGSRIWWCPTGAISHLPLHAAGDYTKPGQNLPDLFVSSYIPTLSALLRAQQSLTKDEKITPRILVVGQADTPGQTPLPSVPLEIETIKSIADHITVLEGAQGTCDAALNAMSQHSWIHLSCHGSVDQEKPFRSGFALHDGPLTLLDIARQDLPRADLAFLSACHSAASNRGRPDDVLHLAAGLQFAGYRRVIGTLWAMCDQDGPHITESFYASLLGTGGRQAAKSSAHALHRAVGELRRRGVSYSRWACFVHFGC